MKELLSASLCRRQPVGIGVLNPVFPTLPPIQSDSKTIDSSWEAPTSSILKPYLSRIKAVSKPYILRSSYVFFNIDRGKYRSKQKTVAFDSLMQSSRRGKYTVDR
jgi:hypothetical protein